jgi:glycerol kinase
MNTEGLILTVDQGTTNTKVILVDSDGKTVAQASRPVGIRFPQPGWVEQDPVEIWQSVSDAIDECLATSGNPKLAAIAISNQRESAIAWDRNTGQPVGPLVSWQCQRSAAICEELRKRGHESDVRARSGLTIDPMFSASKMRWLLDHAADGLQRAELGELYVGTVDSWLLWNLTGGAAHSCDVTNASRTQLFNIHTLAWDPVLLTAFGVPLAALPTVQLSSFEFGISVPNGELPGDVVIGSMIGDSHGALFGHAAFSPGSVKATYGTGSSLMSPIEHAVISDRGVSTTIAWGEKTVMHALEGNIYVTGAAVQWLADLLGFENPSEAAALAATVESAEGLYFVPAFVGLGAPHWDDQARGLVTGITRGTTRAHMARAVIESIAYQIRDVFDAMQHEVHDSLNVLFADGGASRNDLLMQFQADIIGRPVLRNNSTVLSALGAAYLAGLTVGIWSSKEEIASLPRPIDRFEPKLAESGRRALYMGWQEAIARAVFDPE